MRSRNLRLGVLMCLMMVSIVMPTAMAREKPDRPITFKPTVSLNQCTDYHYYSDTFYNGSWINPAWHKVTVPCMPSH